MSLEAINLTNFRSYRERSFSFGKGINLVVGPNASGKTNLLESVFVLAVTKSFRAKDSDLVRHGQTFFRVEARGLGVDFALAFNSDDERREKRVTHNGARKALSLHVGKIGVVLFEPSDLEMVGGAPDTRRRYLDYILCQTNQGYISLLSRYKRVLRQRNALLSEFNTEKIKAEVFVWDIKLTELASEIYYQRKKLLGYLEPLVGRFYEQISKDMVELKFNYLPSIEVNNDYGESFFSKLSLNLTRDLAAGFTTIGPHREDFKVNFGGNSVLSVASRGEVRTVVLAMKLAELQYQEEASGRRPVLLLDDVFSELDYGRRQDLLTRLEGHQCIITTTEADSIKPQIKGDYQLIETVKETEA